MSCKTCVNNHHCPHILTRRAILARAAGWPKDAEAVLAAYGQGEDGNG